MDNNLPFRFTRQLIFTHLVLAALVLFSISCSPQSKYSPGTSVLLAEFSKNSASVSIHLERDKAGKFFLAATYTPIDGFHLYSKDIPRKGIDGVGRPTLLELTPDSKMKATGSLIDSVAAQILPSRPYDLLVYLDSPVTLRLPILLPEGKNMMDDSLSITYMVCSNTICKLPVEGEIIKIKIPGKEYVP